MVSSPITSSQIDREKVEAVTDFILLGAKITVDGDCSHNIKRGLVLGRKAIANLDSILKRHHFADNGPYSQSYGFSSSHVWMWELDNKEDWVPKKWCFLIVVLEKTLENPLNRKNIKSVNPKGNQPWTFIGRTDAEAPILWSPDGKSWLFGKDPDAGKGWGQEVKRATEDEMVEWHHRLNEHEFQQTPGDSGGQGCLACCRPWGLKELGMT